MNRQTEKQKAWDDWHSDLDPDDIPERPDMSFDVGFDAAWDAIMLEIRPLVANLYTANLMNMNTADFKNNAAVRRLRELTRDGG